MNQKELKTAYDELISNIEAAQMFDGRNNGVDIYKCKDCGSEFYTRYKDKGVTPFTIRCRHCKKGFAEHDRTISERIASSLGINVCNWVRPTFEQLKALNANTQKHVLDGGLMLEDELENGKSFVEEKLCQVQDLLDSLQNEKATFLFVSYEGNRFVIRGNPINIEAQILFAMCRYPVVKDIIQSCSENFDEIYKIYGDTAKNVKMERAIEIYRNNIYQKLTKK